MTTRPGMLLLSSAALLLAACNLTPDTSTGDTGGPTGDGGPTVAAIQGGTYVDGDDVRLDGVLVTSPITLDGEGFFVQDPGGGEWSGLYVYLAGGAEGLYLAVGDEITVTGVVTEFYDLTELSVASPASIEVTGTGELTTDVIDPATVTDWEALEGGLVRVNDATVIDCIEYGEAPISDDLSIDDRIVEFESEPGATYTSVTGVISYAYGAWKLYPRTSEDLAGYVAGAGGGVTTVEALQTSEDEACGVTLQDVVVTSPANASGTGFFVSDPVAVATAHSGMYVYVGSAGVPSDVVQGATVTLEGSSIEYDGDEDGTPITEFMPDTITVTGTGTVPAPLSMTSAPTDWAPYDGVLVTLEGLEITDDDPGYGEAATDWGINIDDYFIDFSTTTGDVYDVTGIINQYYGWKVAPRSEDDLAAL